MHRFDNLKSKLKNAMPKRSKASDAVTSVTSVANNVRETGVNEAEEEEEAAAADDDDEEEDEYGKDNNLNKPIEFVITPPCDNQSTPFITYIDDSNQELDAISPLVDEKNFKQLNVRQATTAKFDTASAVDEFYTNQLINSVEFLYTKRSKKQPKSMCSPSFNTLLNL